jgi:hypothetical protein
MPAYQVFATFFAMSINKEDYGGFAMDRELLELIDASMTALERFRFARKRIVTAVLAEATKELLNDGYYDVLANSIIRGLKHQDILRRGQESWALRNVVDRIARLPHKEDRSCSDIVDPETKSGSVPDLVQHDHDNQPLSDNPYLVTSQDRDHRNDQVG